MVARHVLTIRMCRSDPVEYPADYAIRGAHVVLESLLIQHPEAQARGIVMVIDLTDVSRANADPRVCCLATGCHPLSSDILTFRCLRSCLQPLRTACPFDLVEHICAALLGSCESSYVWLRHSGARDLSAPALFVAVSHHEAVYEAQDARANALAAQRLHTALVRLELA